MSHSLTTNPNSSSSESSSAIGSSYSGPSQQKPFHPQLHPSNQSTATLNKAGISSSKSCSALVAASGSLVLENEQILKLFPKCRPRSQNESMNQFYASIKEQHQPPTTSQASASKLYSSTAMKKIITDAQMMSNPGFNSNSSSGGGAANSDYHNTMYAPSKKDRTSTTNPFLTNASDSQKEEQHGGSGRKLSHSQSDCGVCYSGQTSVGANGPFPTSASSSSVQLSSATTTEMMSKNFQRHVRNPLNHNNKNYQSNPFIGAHHKLDEYEEELNIIVQDQQTTAPEYYFDRRTLRPQHHSSHKGHSKPPSSSHPAMAQQRSAPVGHLLHSPEPKESRESHHFGQTRSDYGAVYARDSYNPQQQQHHYLNVGRSPVNSATGHAQLNEADEEHRPQHLEYSQSDLSPTQSLHAAPELALRATKPEPAHESTTNKSSSQFASKKRNKSVAVVSDGEVVIFDDIEESWYNLKTKPESIGEGHVYKQNFIADPDSISPERNSPDGDSPPEPTMTPTPVGANGSSVAGMVIEYSESPRRIGAGRMGQAPRPGFPQRIVTPNSPASSGNPINMASGAVLASSPYYLEDKSKAAVPTPSVAELESRSSVSHKMNMQSGGAAGAILEEVDSSNEEKSHAEKDLHKHTAAAAAFALSQSDDDAGYGVADERADNNEEDSHTGINVAENAYKDTGLSVRDDDYSVPTSTFDYLYEFSETRKVLEEFFKCPNFELDDEKFADKLSDSECDSDIRYDFRESAKKSPRHSIENLDSGSPTEHHTQADHYNVAREEEEEDVNRVEECHQQSHQGRDQEEVANEADVEDEVAQDEPKMNHRRRTFDLSISSLGRQSPEVLGMHTNHHHNGMEKAGEHVNGVQPGNEYFRYSPETTDYDSNCGDLDSLSGDFNAPQAVNNYQAYMRQCYSSMPVLEDGLSSGHASDAENNNARQRNNGKRHNGLPALRPTTHDDAQLSAGVAGTGALSPSNENMTAATTTTSSATPFQLTTATSSVRSIGGGRGSDAGNVTPNHHFMQQQLATDNYYLNATNKQPPQHTCLGNVVLEPELTGSGGGAGVLGKLQSSMSGNNGNPNLVNTLGNRYSSVGEAAQLNEPPLAVSVPELHSHTLDHRNNKSPLLSPLVPRDENLNPVETMRSMNINAKIFKNTDPDLESLYSINKFQSNDVIQMTPPPPAPVPYRKPPLLHPGLIDQIIVPTSTGPSAPATEIQAALKDIRSTIQRTKCLQQDLLDPKPDQMDYHHPIENTLNIKSSAVWIPSFSQCREDSAESESDVLQELKNASDEEEPDTDLETDRLLGHQRSDDTGFYDSDKNWLNTNKRNSLLSKLSPKIPQGALSGLTGGGGIKPPLVNNNLVRHSLNTMIPSPVPATPKTQSSNLMDISESISSPEHSDKDLSPPSPPEKSQMARSDESPGGASLASNTDNDKKKKNSSKSKEVLIEGVLFRAKYLGSTQLVCEGQPTKSTRMMQAEEAVSRIKALAPEGEGQPSTEVDLFISTEKIMVLNTDLKEIMMDHALRTISYIADIGDLVVLMARRRFVPQDVDDDAPKPNRTPKMICHVFESEEAQFIAQSIGQAFQVAYMEFLKANGIEDHSFVKEMDYQEVLNSQEIFGDELEVFAKKELQKEVVVPKAKGEILGVVIVESGWGSMLPTVVIANLLSNGAAARCGHLNIGDQIIAINGLSLVGLPLSTCQTYIKNTKNQTVVKFTVVPCAPVVEVKIKRPNTKYQLGFSVQNGVICSLLRGGIAERGGVRVGHRIIEINNQSVVAVPHEKIVTLLATSVGEILMKTMPTSMFRLLTGQENPIYI